MKPLQFIVLLFGVIVADCVAPRAYGQTSSEVVTLSAGNVIAQGTNASATLNGFVHTNMFPVQAWFEWGEGERFDQQSPATNLVAESIAFELSGLSAGMVYHYRIVVSNNLGVVRGSSVQFATPLVSLQGDNPLLLDYQQPFVDPGARVTAHPLAVKAGRFTSVVLKADGTPVVWGDTTYGLTNLPALEHSVLALRAGAYHALALLQDGSVFGWGRNDSGQVDVPTTVTNPVALAAGGYHSLAVLSDGSVIGWGRDDGGQISIPADATNVVALDAGLYYSAALRADGSVVAWGTNNYGQTDVPADATNVTAIACGSFHMLALREDGTVVSWGRNDDGQTNFPPAVTNVVAIAGGGRYSLALLGDGSLFAWGGTNYSQTNIPPEATNVVSIAAGSSFGLALREDGEVIGWGQDNYGQATVTNNLTSLDAEIQVVGTVDVNVPAQYELSYTATNILGAGGVTSRTVTVLEPVAAPQCVTLAASGLTNGMGTLNGRVFPNGAPTLAWFEWGVNKLYGSNSPSFDVGEGINRVELSYPVSNLTAGVLYHCRIVASNEVALVTGDDRVFWIPQTPLVVTETNDAGPGSLRQALLDANNTTEPDTITFDIGAGGLARIEPLTPLPPITHPVLIDGTTQPGYSGMPLIELSGTNAGASAVGLEIQGGYSTVRGLVINGFLTGIVLTNNGSNVIQGNFLGTDPTGTNATGGVFGVYIVESVANRVGGTDPAERNVISGLTGYGLYLWGPAASNNVIEGNFIGTDVTGRAALGADQNGVYVRAAPYNRVGGTVPGSGNVISGNGRAGVLISRFGSDWATGNRVEGNFIGVDVTGTNALGNGRAGVSLGQTREVWVGGTNVLSRNIIAANGGGTTYGLDEQCGVSLSASGTLLNHVVGNFIGTDVTGTRDLGNDYAGVYIGGGNKNWIGGPEVGAGNLISGNDHTGVILTGDGNLIGQIYARDNIIQGNLIGTDVTGTNALGNTYDGVVIQGRENLVGGSGPGMGNVVSGNGSSGIYLGSAQPYGNRIEGNRIGTDASGTLPLGNGAHGVEVNSYWPQTNVVGGLEAGAGNVIAFNAGSGIAAADNPNGAYRATNAFLGNAIFANGGLGIDLNVDGVTPNDPGDIDNGANALQNFPVLTEAILTNDATRVTGYLDSAPGRMFHIEFFASSACDPSGYGEGQIFLGSTDVTTDGGGSAPFTVDLPAFGRPWFLAATATLDATNSTSEFGPCVQLMGIPYVVETLPATGVVATGSLAIATLQGSVITNVLPSQAWFEWGTDDLTQKTSPVNLAEDDTGFFSTELSGLTAGLVYRYCAFATNNLGLKHGETRSFWVPQLVLQGDDPMVHAVGGPFVDPGATASAFPVEVAAGYYHDLALRPDGSVVGWGLNAHSVLDIPTDLTNAISVAVAVEHSLALRADGTVVAWGRDRFGLLDAPPEATNIVAISARAYHNVALRGDGGVAVWGQNAYGQTNTPANLTDVVAISAGYNHTLALKTNGTLVVWGDNTFGQTNIPPSAANIVAIAAGPANNLAVRDNGTVIVWGNTNQNQGEIPPTATNIIAVASGQSHVLALREDGTIVSWGQNVYGQTDIPPDATNVVAISALGDHSLALRGDGALIAWGKGDYGQTNIPGDLTLLDLPVTVTGSVNVNVPGTYVLTYSTTNSSGAAATTTRTVVVETLTQPLITGTKYLEDGSFHFTFTNIPGALFNVLATTNVSLPLSQWTLLGMPIEGPSGVFQFTDVTATNQSQRYYRLVWP